MSPTTPHSDVPDPAPGALPPELKPLQEGDPAAIGAYRVVGRLGSGGMGAVYGALDDQGRCLAVKVIHEEHAAKAEFRSGFAQEVELMRQVGGVCTAAVHAADTEAQRPWVATDFIAGQTLGEHVRAQGPLEGDMLWAYAAGTAEALHAVHAAGIVHCDLKPANIMLAPDGPKVLDFGIAHPVAAAASSGAVFGSPGWMSPERYRGAVPTRSGDVFAWAATVAFAATGRAPFGRAEPAEMARRAAEDAPDLDGVPDELLALIEPALAKDTEARPSAEDLFGDLLASADEPGDAAPAEPGRIEALRALLGEHWHGIDAGWHQPALWAAAAGGSAALAGAQAAAGASIVSGLAGTGASAGASTATGGSAAIASTSAATAATATATTAGGLKIAAIVTAGVLVTGTITAGGYVAYQQATDGSSTAAAPSPSPSPTTPAQVIGQAADLAARASSLTAEETSRLTQEGAERSAEEAPGGPSADILRALSGSESDYTYSASPAPIFKTDYIAEGAPVEYLYSEGDVLVRSDEEEWQRNPAYATPKSYSLNAFLRPLRAIADTGEVASDGKQASDGTPAQAYSGTFTVAQPRCGYGEEAGSSAEFDLLVDDAGYPLHLEFTSNLCGYTIDYTGFGDPVTIETPDPSVIAAGICGTLPAARVDGEVEIDATRADVSCEEAMSTVEGYFTGEATAPPVGGSGGYAEINGWTCGWNASGELDRAEPGEQIGRCSLGDQEVRFLKTE